MSLTSNSATGAATRGERVRTGVSWEKSRTRVKRRDDWCKTTLLTRRGWKSKVNRAARRQDGVSLTPTGVIRITIVLESDKRDSESMNTSASFETAKL